MTSRRHVIDLVSVVLIGTAGCLGTNSDDESTTDYRGTQEPVSTQETTLVSEPSSTGTPTEEVTTPTTTPPATPAESGTPTITETPSPEPASTVTVRISGGAFEPQRLSVAPNTRINWVNEDIDMHQIESMRVGEETTSWEFSSGKFGRGGRVGYVFRDPGVYAYFSSRWGKSTSCGLVNVGDATYNGDLPCESSGGY